MTDRASSDKAGEKSFFARTAKNTSKRAKRAQEKVKRKLGKSDETKDEIFDRFVENFHNQQDAVQRLENELKNYINCVKAMMNANQLFSEAVKEVYEPDWSERDKFINLLDSIDFHWNNLIEKLQDEVLEPLTSYQTPFPDTKNRISKRNRKLVDYDRHRHHVETLKIKGGKSAEPKKLSQAEDDYNQAKSVYLQLHSDLYDELPAIYDSRIAFYVSSFQSIFTAEGVFHREASEIKTQMIDMLDVLAKETSAGTYSTRRPLSGISNASSDGENSPFEQPDNFTKLDNTDNSENAQSENEEDLAAIGVKLNDSTHSNIHSQPISHPDSSIADVDVKPAKESDLDDPKELSVDHSPPPLKRPVTSPPPPSPVMVENPPPSPVMVENPPPSPGMVEKPPSSPVMVEKPNPPIMVEKLTPPVVVEKPTPPVMVETPTVESPPPPQLPNGQQEKDEKSEQTFVEKEIIDVVEEHTEDAVEHDSEQEKSSEEEKAANEDQEHRVLYKVIATHPYNGEDEDELSFEKGEVIQVLMYEESDDPDDGWLMGISETTGTKGVFPENFTTKLTEISEIDPS